MGNFVHLHLHTEYSLLDGACRISDIPKKAKELYQDAVAMTDHGNLYGAVAFYEACKRENIKPIIGCEVYVSKRSLYQKDGKQDFSGNHLILLCENQIGYQNLITLVSKSFIDGFYMKPRIDLELLEMHHEGLICLSACLAGAIPQEILIGNYDKAKEIAQYFQKLFGKDHFYLEIQNHNNPDEVRVAMSLQSIAKETDIPLVCTNDVHYLNKKDAKTQEILMCIQTGKTLEEGKPIGFETDEFYFKSTEEMTALFSNYENAVENTVKIANMCNFDFEFGNYKLPTYKIPSNTTHEQILKDYTYTGFESKIQSGEISFDKHTKEEYLNRLSYELSVIHQMGFDAYYLIVRDFVIYSKTHGITVGPGRGSGAGSLVAYCIGITGVNSIEYDLLFERFLNPDRQTMPDFDIDFDFENRQKAIDYVKSKYGDDHVSQIVTFGTLAAKAAVKDVGRVIGMPLIDVTSVTKYISDTIEHSMQNPELKKLYDTNYDVKQLLDLAKSVEGMPRHASTHAAGVVITENPVSSYVPLATNGDVVVTQFDMDTIAKLGLIKFDFLGIRYLTVIDKAVDMIHKKDPSFDILKIPFQDKKTYDMISLGETDGVFQLESPGLKRVLTELKPSCIEDLIATIALYRPGPMDSIDTFIARKHGREPVVYDSPKLEPILASTYGCIVYQEQVMQICQALAGYSLAHADIVRRAMSKKKHEVMQKEKELFISGCLKNGTNEYVASKIFSEMENFASYAFNKSHAAAYAFLTYRTAYLKAYYPAEYYAALMSCGVTEDPAHFNVKILPPDINRSTEYFSIEGNDVRFGLLWIKNVGIQFATSIQIERQKKPFTSFEDFVERMVAYDSNKRQIEVLIKSGCFDSFGIYRSRLLAAYEELIAKHLNKLKSNVTGQLDIFSVFADETFANQTVIYPELDEIPFAEKLKMEKELTGFYLSGNFFNFYDKHAKDFVHEDIAYINSQLADLEDIESQTFKVTGFLSSFSIRNTKKGQQMAIGTLEDRTGSLSILIFPKQFEANKSFLKENSGYYMEGSFLQRENAKPEFVVNHLVPLVSNDKYQNGPDKGKKLFLKVDSMNSEASITIQSILQYVKGTTPVVFYDLSSKKYFSSPNYSCKISDQLLRDFKQILGESSVVLM